MTSPDPDTVNRLRTRPRHVRAQSAAIGEAAAVAARDIVSVDERIAIRA